MKTTLAIAVGLLVASGAGCAHNSGSTGSVVQGPSPAEYYPLQIGNHWTYQTHFLGESRRTEVKIERQADGFFVDSTGAQLMVDGYGVRDQKRYLLRSPLEVGKGWTNVVSVSSVEHYQVLEVGQPCEVPAGKFESCVKVEGRNRVDAHTTLVNELTFARGVGLVRLEVFAQTPSKRIPQTQLELVEYAISAETRREQK